MQATELRPPPKMIKFLNFCINFFHFAPLPVLRLGRVPHLSHPCYGSCYMIFHVLTAWKMSMLVLSVVTLCGLVGRYQRFEET
jgi:hypothetical protein